MQPRRIDARWSKIEWLFDRPAQREKILKLPETAIERLERNWHYWRRPDQAEPDGDWRTWLVMAGRGFGKTRMGAEWVRAAAERTPGIQIALVGATDNEVRRVMVEGPSGLLAIAHWRLRPSWEPTLGRLTWPGGAQAHVYAASEPERLRGPQHHIAWADEIGKWAHADEAWDNLMMTLRMGDARVIATTTPRPIKLVRRLVAEEKVRKTYGRTRGNRAHLADAFLQDVEADYAGTRLGRQELDGELIEDVEGALWTRDLLEKQRARRVPELVRVVVGVDPPASATGDACGIVAMGLGRDACGYVLEDASVSGMRPEGWASAVAACAARHGADCVVAEANQGGDMVTSVLHSADAGLAVRKAYAKDGKVARAEPVQLKYEAGRIFHVGAFPELEDELCGMQMGGGYQGPGRSPDRGDALVWAATELMLGKARGARISFL